MHIAQSNGRVSSRTLLQDLTTLTPGSTHSTGVDAAAPSTDTPAVAPTVASPQSSTLPILPSMPTPAPAPATSPMAVSVPSPAPSPFAGNSHICSINIDTIPCGNISKMSKIYCLGFCCHCSVGLRLSPPL